MSTLFQVLVCHIFDSKPLSEHMLMTYCQLDLYEQTSEKYGSGHGTVAASLIAKPGNETATVPWPDSYTTNYQSLFQENALENVVFEMLTILFIPQCVHCMTGCGLSFRAHHDYVSKWMILIDIYIHIYIYIYIYIYISPEYWVVRNRYSLLLFTSEDRLCANLRVQKQSTIMTSRCQCLACAWRLRPTVMTSQC